MAHMAQLGEVEIPITYSKDEAVGFMQEMGIVGAGGAGFPTYVKYQHPKPMLLVNVAESEPGYYANKLLIRDEPEALVNLFEWMRHALSIEAIIVGAEDVARPYMQEFEALAKRLHDFSISYIEPKYKYGQEKALCEAVLGMHIPKDEIPPDEGVIVNNNETLLNVYRALFQERPVVTKFLQVYGEVGPPRVFEAPVGSIAADLLRIYGVKPEEFQHCHLFDGGPVLAEQIYDKMGPEPAYGIRRTTNALLVVHPEKDRPRKKWYPSPDFKHNTIDAPWAPTEIVNVEDRIDRVRVPLTGRFWRRGKMVVRVGEHVHRGDDLAVPALAGLSVGVHASITGRVTQITEDFVQIERK